MGYKKYKGSDKYHFRFYKVSKYHPFIVVAVTEEKDEDGKVFISGYMMTTSLTRAMEKPGTYKRLRKNPNPHYEKISFVNRYRINDIPSNCFTKPHTSWHLEEDDVKLIDALESKYFKNHR